MKLRSKLILTFLLLSIIPMIVVGYLAYDKGERALKQDKFDDLVSVNILKSNNLSDWLHNKQNTLQGFANNPFVMGNVTVLVSQDQIPSEYAAIHKRLIEDYLAPAVQGTITGFTELSVVRAGDGLVLASTNEKAEGESKKYELYFIRGKQTTYVDSIFNFSTVEPPALIIGTPVKDAEGNLIAVLAGRVNLDELSGIMAQASSLSQTQDTYLIDDSGSFVTAPRLSKGYILNKATRTEGTQTILESHENIIVAHGSYKNYRGVPVIGAYQWIPEWGWYIQTEIDQSEALKPIHDLRNIVLAIGGIVAVVVAALALFFSRTITRPVHRLAEGAGVIGSGNLDFKVGTAAKDEIGDLSRSFDLMAENLKGVTVSRDALNKEISERKRMEETLKTKEAFLAESQRMAHLGNWEWNIITKEIVWSDEVYRIHGFQPQEFKMTLRRLMDSVHPDDREDVGSSFNSALHGGKSYNIDFRLLLPNGEVRIVHEEGVVLLDKSGNPIHASGTVQDITERKRVEEKLAESERLYSSMANSSPIGVYIIQDGKFTFANQKFCDMTGFSRNELSDMEPWSLVHPKDREMVRVNAVRMLKGRSSVAYEYRAIIKNGETRVILETVASIQHLGKRATLGNYMDITERKQMERDIQDKKEQLAAQNEELQQKIEEIAKARAYSDGLLSSMSDAFLLLDFDGIVHDANDVYFKMMGYTREEVLGQLMKTAPLTQEGIKTAFERLKKHKAGIQMGNWETTITNNYGEKVTMDVSPNVIRDAQGNPAMLFTVLRDITERKRMEEKLKEYSGNLEKMVEERTKELKDAQADLVRSERLAMLGQFSGSISHELRNPLGVIDSSAYYLKTKLEGIDEKVSLHLDRIKSAAGKANAIIQSILELTRMHDPKLDRLDINAVIAGAIAVSNVPAKVNLMQDYSEPEIWVNGDLEQLLMAFQNIIKNAVEAMEGAGTLKLTVHTTIDGRVEISIGDSGMGIAPENLANIFEPLFSTKAKGIGFGLAITRMVIEKHKGTIEVKSEVGKGTTFIVRLPQSIVEKS